MESTEIDLSQEGLDFALATQGGLRTMRFGLPGRTAWSDPASHDPVFAVHANGQVIDGTTVSERWLTVRNVGANLVRFDRLDSISLDIPADRYELISFTSAWGLEFEEVREPLTGATVLE